SVHLCFVCINFRSVKSSEIIDGRHHILQREMCFQIKTLETFYGIRGRMPLGKRITGKTLNLPPYFFCKRGLVSFFIAIFKELSLYLLEFFTRTKFSAHPSSQHIGLSQIKSGKI